MSLIPKALMNPMRILLLGSGGREHALAWKLNQSTSCTALFIAPGNPGTASHGTNVDLHVNDIEGIAGFCKQNNIDMVVVGPEEPLVNGLYDHFKADPALAATHFIGPSKYGAQLEGSKSFAKAFMNRHGIPTAKYKEFTNENFIEGIEYLKSHDLPLVLKADGLAAGKGVLICQTHLEAIAEFELMLQQEKFGQAGRRVVVEEFLTGVEMSSFVLTDGKEYVILPDAKDYKRIGVGDKGLNTGGMGAVSPVPFADEVFMQKVEERVIRPTVEGLAKENIEYTGFIFVGIINVDGEPYVIEYNCRMGDPETEVVMPRLKSDLVEVLLAASKKELSSLKIETDPRSAATVVVVSEGYPGPYEKGFPIEGLDEPMSKYTIVFHAGTKLEGDTVVTNGGRVLCVTSFGEDIEEAVNTSLDMLQMIHFDGMYYRTDIGYEFIEPRDYSDDE